MDNYPDAPRDMEESDFLAAEQPLEGTRRQDDASKDTPALEDCIGAWADAVDLDQRHAMERRIAEMLRGPLTECVRAELYRLGKRSALPSAEDVVNQTVVELPMILEKYLESATPTNPEGFRSYLLGAARNVTRDLANRPERDRARLARLAASHPSRMGHVPTTPSQSEMRSEIRELLAGEFSHLAGTDQEILRRRSAGASFAEIGRELGMPRETVRDRYRTSSALLRRIVERALGGDPFGE